MNNNIEEKKYLPIGTVVKLKSATKNVMITSYLVFPNGENAKDDNKNVMYDYGGCSFPEGIIDSSKILICTAPSFSFLILSDRLISENCNQVQSHLPADHILSET